MRTDSDTTKKKILTVFLLILGLLPGWINGFYFTGLSKHPYYYWIYEMFVWICVPLIIYEFGRHQLLFTNRQIGFHSLINGRYTPSLLVLNIGIFTIIIYFAHIFFNHISRKLFLTNFGAIDFTYHQVIPSGGIGFLHLVVVLYFSVSAGIVEEFLCRGLFRCAFNRSGLGNLLYILVSSAAFAALHWEGGIQNVFATFLFGILLAVIYVKVDNLWPLVFGHFYTDFFWFM